MKWEHVGTKVMIRERFNAIWGIARTDRVLCDVYRKKRWNGMYKFKYVPQW